MEVKPLTVRTSHTAKVANPESGETKPRIYFTHPIRTYGTPEALAVYQAIKRAYPAYEVIDPEELKSPGNWQSCRQCMDKTMKKLYFPLIEKCEKLVLWNPIDTCGVQCELYHAWMTGKEILYVDASYPEELDFEPLSLQEFYYMWKEN